MSAVLAHITHRIENFAQAKDCGASAAGAQDRFLFKGKQQKQKGEGTPRSVRLYPHHHTVSCWVLQPVK